MTVGIHAVLIANRGEIAVRIARAAADLAIRSVAVHSQDDGGSMHVATGDQSWELSGSGPRAYLDIDQIVAAAVATGCDALHPGYGFLAENAALANACAAAGITFVGPSADHLRLFGDKTVARDLAALNGVPVVPAGPGVVDVDGAARFLASLGPGGAMLIKAVAGGGGRGCGSRVPATTWQRSSSGAPRRPRRASATGTCSSSSSSMPPVTSRSR